jgi:hypothetical protein
MAEKLKNNDMLEAPFTILCNDMFHKKCESVKEEVGSLESKRIFEEWNAWLRREVKKKGIK